MRFRLAQPAVLVDISRIDGLEYVKDAGTHLAIGAMTREATLETSADAKGWHMLADATHVIADPLVRNKGTVGGNIAHADPANDHPAVMLAYNAQVIARGPKGERQIDIDNFFVDIFTSALQKDEILREIRIPKPAANSGSAYIKLERKVGDYAISAVAVNLVMDGNVCKDVRIGLTNVSAVPMRARNAEAAMRGKALTEDVLEAAGKAAAAECEPNADLRGSVEYKRDLTRVLLKRAVRKAAERAKQ
jgi:carbon-monoxide dehydrogenase medium subunit